MICHIVVHAAGRLTPLAPFEAAAVTWRRVREEHPLALAAVLMPDHFHLLVDVADPEGVRRRLGALLSGLTRSEPYGRRGRRLWDPVPTPDPVRNLRHLRRDVRYLALNPCREGLCRDPLSWIWSTHRDVMGAVADPWVTADRLAAALRVSARGFASAHHAYVAADPTVHVAGTPAPTPAPARDVPVVALEAVALAAAAALRLPAAAVATDRAARRLFVQLARDQGWRDTGLLARRCGIGNWQVGHLARQPARGLEAARLCLGDERLVCGSMPCQITARV